MLAMYVHTHWSYAHPYSARTWTLDDWKHYIMGLKAMGFDTVTIWPQLETMPTALTSSDEAFLRKLGEVITFLHKQDMRAIITSAPNIMPTAKSADYPFEKRYFWECAHYVNPSDAAAVRAMIEDREHKLGFLGKADGLHIIDSDPGGWKGSPAAEFVHLFNQLGSAMRRINRKADVYYWLWGGWGHDNRIETYVETLTLMKKQLPWPWKAFSCYDRHLEALDRAGIKRNRGFSPYGLIEDEPSFPMVNSNPSWFRGEMARFDRKLYPLGIMVNAQTHCLQLPYTYLAAHYAKGGTRANEKLEVFAQSIVPGGNGLNLAEAWDVLEHDDDAIRIRQCAQRMRTMMNANLSAGPMAKMALMDLKSYLQDMADNCDIRASFIDLRHALDAGGDGRAALKQLLPTLRSYQQRVGYNYMSGGALKKGLLEQLCRLGKPELAEARRPVWEVENISKKGYLVNLFDLIEDYGNGKF